MKTPVTANWIVPVLCCTLLTPWFATTTSAQETRPEEQPEEPAQQAAVCVTIDGTPYTIDRFHDFLAARFGPQALGEFADQLLLEREAQRMGVTAAPADVDAEVNRRLDQLRGLFPEGDLLGSLEQRGFRASWYRSWLEAQVGSELILAAVIQQRREVTDEQVRVEFERLYGPDGTARELRHILVSSRLARVPIGKIGDANQILEQVRAGHDFAELARRHSQDPVSADRGGALQYLPGALGARFDSSVAQLTEPGQACLAESVFGLHVVQLVALRQVTVDEMQEALRLRMRQRPPSPTETALLLQQLREKANIDWP